MKVLVTGNLGYIGSRLTNILLERGYTVRGLDTEYYRGGELIPLGFDIQQIRKDIRDVDISDVKGMDAVIHLAALSNDPLGQFNPELTYDINYRASIRLAELAKKAGINRFVVASSCSLYGIKGDEEINEEAPMEPVTAYAKSKVRVEKDLRKMADSSFSPVFMRPSTVYGVAPRLRVDIVLNNLVGWAFTTGKIKILSDGSPWRPAVHVEDISKAFIAALEAPQDIVHAEAFNVGQNKENYQIKDMAEAVKKVIPDCEIEFTGEHGSDSRTYIVNFDKIKERLKFNPTWDIHKGAKELADAFKEHGLTEKEFTGNKFIRINRLKQLLNDKRINNELRWIDS